jgi:predicted nucleotidyltransferase
MRRTALGLPLVFYENGRTIATSHGPAWFTILCRSSRAFSAVSAPPEAKLRQRGVIHVAVFGSVVGEESRADSDVDLLVDLTPDLASDFFAYAGVAADLDQIVGRDVDVARRDKLRPHVRPSRGSVFTGVVDGTITRLERARVMIAVR